MATISSIKLCCKGACQIRAPTPARTPLFLTPTCSSVSHSPRTCSGLPQSADSRLADHRALGAAAFQPAHTAKTGSQQGWCWAWPHPVLPPEPPRPECTAAVGPPLWSSVGPGAPGVGPPAGPHSGPLASGGVWLLHMVRRYKAQSLAAQKGSRNLHL